MTKPQRKEFVTFYSPGTFVAESTTRPIETRDTKIAAQMAHSIEERHASRPYGFRFETRIVADDVPDGEGGFLRVPSKVVDESGTYFLSGTLYTYDDAVARNDEKEAILRSNMRGNGWWIVCVTANSWKSIQPFGEKDFVVSASGEIVERGDDPKHVAYRKQKTEERDREYERMKEKWA